MVKVLVLGGGFGGISAALRLRERLDASDDIVLVDREAGFSMGLRKIWEIVGEGRVADGTRPRAALERHGISVRHATVEAVDPGRLTATLDGEELTADGIIVALGATLAPEVVPGLAPHAINAWDRSDAARAAAALEAFDGGRILVGIFGTPYACPPAPYELAMRLAERCRQRDVAAEIGVFTPTPIALPVLGPEGSAELERLLSVRGIAFRAQRQASEVGDGVVAMADGEELAFDLLFAVPPHRGPSVLTDAGLAPPGGWVPVDRATMATGHSRVYAVGDCAAVPLREGMPMPKAGVMAEIQGAIAAEQLAVVLRGGQPERVSGEAICYAETGSGEAAPLRARLFDDPPVARLELPTRQGMEGKRAFERDRLEKWFGAETAVTR